MKPKIKAFIEALRPRTLPLSLSGVLLGSLLAIGDGSTEWAVMGWALLTTASLQVLSNLANEIGDYDRGTDNGQRLGPRRGLQSGLLSRREMTRIMLCTGIVAAAAGILLIRAAFPNLLSRNALLLLLAGAASLVAAVKYTFGRGAYGYHGLGDLFVYLFFGIVSVCGSYFAMTAHLSPTLLLPASTIGFLSAGVLNINNLRDADNDAACGKHTLVVLLGTTFSRRYHALLLLMAPLCLVAYNLLTRASWSAYLFLLLLPWGWHHLRHVLHHQGKALDSQLRSLSLLTLATALLRGLTVLWT